jgi:hypothetical protein
MTDEKSAQAENQPSETFKALLDAYLSEIAEGWEGPDQQHALYVYVARLEAKQITPEIVAMLSRLGAGRGVDIMDDGYLTWSEEDRLKRDIVDALRRLVKGETE